ncbi:MAG: winged helix-turn-helix domain-containing protein [Chloroflexi bacterium]|nr:winged helix-turn-helix domain-containing protein [Chloroflexota bacterium]
MTENLILKTESETLKFRLATLLVASAALLWFQREVALLPAVTLVFVYLAYLLALRYYILPRFASPYTVIGMVIVDAVMLSTAMFITGGVVSPLFILFPVFIIYYSIYLGYVSSLAAATAFSLGYGILIIVQGAENLVGGLVAIQVPLFYFLAVFSGYLAQKRFREREEKEVLQQILRVENRARGLLEAAKSISRTLELSTVVEDIIENAPAALNLSHCLLFLADGASLTFKQGNISPQQLAISSLPETSFTPTPDSLIAKAMAAGTAVALSPTTEGKGALPPWAQGLSLRTFVAIPLKARGETVGAIFLFDFHISRAFTPEELRLAQGYGELAGNAISHAIIHERGQSRVQQLATEMESVIQRMDRGREQRRKGELQIGDLYIDGPKGQVSLEGKRLSLSPTEFEVLYLLSEHAGRPLNQETILRRVWGDEYHGQTNVVDVCIHRLRRKLADTGAQKRIITIRGEGYMMRRA